MNAIGLRTVPVPTVRGGVRIAVQNGLRLKHDCEMNPVGHVVCRNLSRYVIKPTQKILACSPR